MRIVGGRLKGRNLKSPGSNRVRPTSDRLRETIFNILVHAYGNPVEGARVIDLFAGTGAMGFEALSRGADFVLFVDQAEDACRTNRTNIQALGFEGATQILRRDARKLGMAPCAERYDIVFVDPPYGRGLVTPALSALREGGWLSKDGFIIIEESVRCRIDCPENFTFIAARSYGDTQVVLARVK